MRLVLGFLFCDRDFPYLKLHLPVVKDAFDGVVALTDFRCSPEPVAWLREQGVTVNFEDWRDDWSHALNTLTWRCEVQGFDTYMRLDPDELVFPGDVALVRQALDEAPLVYLNKLNFWYDRRHVSAQPNWLPYAFRLGRGIGFSGKRHENINPTGRTIGALAPIKPQIFHYGWLRDTLMDRELRYLNMAQRDAGQPEAASIPPIDRNERRPEAYRAHAGYFTSSTLREYTDPQPLDPNECGAFAPWED